MSCWRRMARFRFPERSLCLGPISLKQPLKEFDRNIRPEASHILRRR